MVARGSRGEVLRFGRLRWGGQSVRPLLVLVASAALLCGALSVLVSSASATFPGRNGLIAFSYGKLCATPGCTIGGYGSIETIHSNGSGLHRLAHGNGYGIPGIGAPVFSPDGTSIVFGGLRPGGGTPNVMLMNVDGSHLHQLTTGFDPVFTPTGSILYFTMSFSRQTDQSTYLLWSIDATGSNAHVLLQRTYAGPRSGFINLAVSPDGKTVAFAQGFSRSCGSPNIYTMGLDGSNVRRVASCAGSPDYSPDGRHILFERSGSIRRKPALVIWIMNSDGSGQRRLIANPVSHSWGGSSASFSPDGRYVTFERRVFPNSMVPTANRSNLYVMNVDGSGLRRVTHETSAYRTGADPVWQPLP